MTQDRERKLRIWSELSKYKSFASTMSLDKQTYFSLVPIRYKMDLSQAATNLDPICRDIATKKGMGAPENVYPISF